MQYLEIIEANDISSLTEGQPWLLSLVDEGVCRKYRQSRTVSRSVHRVGL